ncbi:hypothetical protein BDW27_106256 [Nocardiopsis sp. L17-MgMaSL7]|nr:hypothetical protein BDW27_106256 [Nocardiopsis sp. L17-MgMaSL7]
MVSRVWAAMSGPSGSSSHRTWRPSVTAMVETAPAATSRDLLTSGLLQRLGEQRAQSLVPVAEVLLRRVVVSDALGGEHGVLLDDALAFGVEPDGVAEVAETVKAAPVPSRGRSHSVQPTQSQCGTATFRTVASTVSTSGSSTNRAATA